MSIIHSRERVRFRADAQRPVAHDGSEPAASSDGTPVENHAPDRHPYEVGYGRPPAHTRFKKGQSGNPKGRPKGSPNVATVLHDLVGTRRMVRIDGKEKKLNGIEIILQVLLKKAMGGDLKAAREILALIRKHQGPTSVEAASTSAANHDVLDDTDVAMLRHHYGESFAADGMSPHDIERILTTFGLPGGA